MTKIELDALHATIAREIKIAKRAMFKRNREGVNPRDSYLAFMGNIGVEIANKVFPSKPDHVTATLPDGQEVELHGDAVDLMNTDAAEPANAEEQTLREHGSAEHGYVPYCQDCQHNIKSWTAEVVKGLDGDCHPEPYIALLRLLDAIYNVDSVSDASMIAWEASHEAFRQSTEMIDLGIELVLASKAE